MSPIYGKPVSQPSDRENAVAMGVWLGLLGFIFWAAVVL